MNALKIYEKYSHLSPQRSPQWFESRKKLVGASEVWLLSNNFDKFKEMKSKTELITNNSCIFGTVFEDIAKNYLTSYTYIKEIFNLGSIAYHDTSVPLGASTDGLFDSLSEPSLLEIKCPLYRKVTDVVPVKYHYQMQAQLMCIPEVKCVTYMDFQFRISNKFQWTSGLDYNRWLHVGRKAYNPTPAYCLCKGVIEIVDKQGKDIGAGKWSSRKCNVDLTPLADNTLIFHNFITKFPTLTHSDSSFVCWHLDHVAETKFYADSEIQAHILSLVTSNALLQFMENR